MIHGSNLPGGVMDPRGSLTTYYTRASVQMHIVTSMLHMMGHCILHEHRTRVTILTGSYDGASGQALLITPRAHIHTTMQMQTLHSAAERTLCPLPTSRCGVNAQWATCEALWLCTICATRTKGMGHNTGRMFIHTWQEGTRLRGLLKQRRFGKREFWSSVCPFWVVFDMALLGYNPRLCLYRGLHPFPFWDPNIVSWRWHQCYMGPKVEKG